MNSKIKTSEYAHNADKYFYLIWEINIYFECLAGEYELHMQLSLRGKQQKHRGKECLRQVQSRCTTV